MKILQVADEAHSWDERGREYLEMNPLQGDRALDEAQVLDVRFNVLTGRAAVLLELRQALQLRHFTTGLFLASGVTELQWSADPREATRTAWTISGWNRGRTAKGDHWQAGLFPSGYLSLIARSAQFIGGDVPGLADVPTDYDGPDDVVAANLASWVSEFDVRCVARLDAESVGAPTMQST